MMEFRRYHPLTVLFELIGFLKNAFFFVILLYVVNYNSQSFIVKAGRIIFWIAIILTVSSLVLKWFTDKYATDEEGFHLRSGIFEKTERTIYFEKVQNVQRHRSFLHKILKVTSISFQTAATGIDSNVEFKAVTSEEANRLERLIKLEGSNENEVANVDANNEGTVKRIVHFTPTSKDVFKASFTSLSFLVLIVVIASIFSKIEVIFNVEQFVEGWLRTVLTSGWLIAGIAAVLIIVSFVAGYVWTYFKYGKYEISSDEMRIYISKGILDETDFSIRKSRVQGIEITQTFMKRLLGLAEVKLISAGDLGSDDNAVSTLYPFLPVKRAYQLVEEMLPHFKIGLQMRRLPRKSLLVKLIRPYWIWLAVTGVLFYFKSSIFSNADLWWLFSLLFLVLIIASRVSSYFGTQYSIDEDFIQVSEGVFGRTIFITKRKKIIEVSVKRSKLQQVVGLATIGFVNRAQPIRHETIADLPVETAQQFYKWYLGRSVEVQIK